MKQRRSQNKRKQNLKSILIDRGFYNHLKDEFIEYNAKFDFKIKSFYQLKDIIKF